MPHFPYILAGRWPRSSTSPVPPTTRKTRPSKLAEQSLPQKLISTEEKLGTRERPAGKQCSRSPSPQSTGLKPRNLPHSSTQSSVSHPHRILNPTVVREELDNSRARSFDPAHRQPPSRSAPPGLLFSAHQWQTRLADQNQARRPVPE
ncbi:hypothetical protein PTTG_28416 [Puccinia triticina 1-1 BBBD Race 1]|uniref:Uncharacterized protein n=2 Tax=Puccinia triticina TaxID=208348 RepID=A0A180GC27_PUCT1|nr:hypothetical protein PTTG_28416 [Puccinia triticina 1-1 BBBD Race 1]